MQNPWIYIHSYTSESKLNKCNNCDFACEYLYTIEVHISKCRKEDFECGLCAENFQDEISLEVYLRACEIYECCKCWKRVKNLSDMKRHILAKHSESVNLNHLKIDREKEFNVKTKTYDLKEVWMWLNEKLKMFKLDYFVYNVFGKVPR